MKIRVRNSKNTWKRKPELADKKFLPQYKTVMCCCLEECTILVLPLLKRRQLYRIG